MAVHSPGPKKKIVYRLSNSVPHVLHWDGDRYWQAVRYGLCMVCCMQMLTSLSGLDTKMD